LKQHRERVFIVLLRARDIDVVSGEFRRRDAAADAEIDPATAEVVEHADLFQQPQRMIERQQIQERAKADALGLARGRGKKHRRRGGRR
jgi:hypothetical protein